MDQRKLIEYVLLASMTGAAGMVVSNIGKMSENLQDISNSVQELNSRIQVLTTQMVQTNDVIRDHEARIRKVEKVK